MDGHGLDLHYLQSLLFYTSMSWLESKWFVYKSCECNEWFFLNTWPE